METIINIDAGFSHIAALNSEAHHAHEEYVVTLLLSGYVTLKNEQTVQILPGTMTLVPSGQPHALVEGKEMSVHWLSFGLGNNTNVGTNNILLPFERIRQGALPIFRLPKERVTFIVTLFEELERELASAKSGLVLESLVNLIVNEATKASALTEKELRRDTKIGKAIQFIERHSCEGISLKDVAEAVHVSPAHLATKIKQSTGFTVVQWITKHRLKVAAELLVNTDHTIENIATKVGWADVTHFIRQFKKAYQKTPSAWRKHQRETYI